jgi:hypothetical protein
VAPCTNAERGFVKEVIDAAVKVARSVYCDQMARRMLISTDKLCVSGNF